MKSIVITGSTSEIGLGLADAFLARDCAVVISGHFQINLDKAYGILAGKYDKSRISAYLSDVSHYDEVQGLWNAAVERFGRVDIWINNAGAKCQLWMFGLRYELNFSSLCVTKRAEYNGFRNARPRLT